MEKRNPVVTRWDNIVILQAIDRHQEITGGRPVTSVNACDLMEEIAGRMILSDDPLVAGFVRELEIAESAGLLTYRVYLRPEEVTYALRTSRAYQYLQDIRDLALTVEGQDRARGRLVVRDLPDPALDDGRKISRLILRRVAEAIEEEYGPAEAVEFVMEECATDKHLTLPEGDVEDFLAGLYGLGSPGRRALRSFLGRWLSDLLISGPSEELRRSLIDQLARQGWYVDDGDLVIGERAAGSRATSLTLKAARLAALHPEVVSVVTSYLDSGHYGAAVLEAVKALNERVRKLSGRTEDGTDLMHKAFKGSPPPLPLADLSTETGRSIQDGYHFIFAGVQGTFRNPAAHQPLEALDIDETFERLGLISLLMRPLDQIPASPGAGEVS